MMKNNVIRLFVLVMLCMLPQGCVVPTDSPDEELKLVHAAVPDTISPWDSIAVVFSQPLRDSLVVFTVTPPLYMYSQRMNETNDTVFISSVEPFDGNKRYVIRLKETVTAQNGVVLGPENDSLVVVTAPLEKEPNDNVLTADSLESCRFGSVATVNDTDFYLLAADNVEKVYLSCFETQCTCRILDGKGRRTAERSYVQSDTLELPDDFTPPLYVLVSGFYRSAGGSYEVGVILTDD